MVIAVASWVRRRTEKIRVSMKEESLGIDFLTLVAARSEKSAANLQQRRGDCEGNRISPHFLCQVRMDGYVCGTWEAVRGRCE